MHLAAITGGTFTDAPSANVLATVLLDTLLSSVLPPAAIARANPQIRVLGWDDMAAYDILGRKIFLTKNMPDSYRPQTTFRVGSKPIIVIMTDKQGNKVRRTLLWR